MSQRDELSNKDKLEAAQMLEWMGRMDDARFIQHHQKPADLILYNHSRGMSRSTMNRIWGRKLVNVVIGPETTIFAKETKPNEKARRT